MEYELDDENIESTSNKEPESSTSKEPDMGSIVSRLRSRCRDNTSKKLNERCDKEIFAQMNDILSNTRTRSASFMNNNDNEIIAEDSRATITRKDFKTLDARNWLNDQIIDYYLGMISDRSQNSNLPKVYCASTFFYASLLSHGYKNVKRWLKKVDLFSFDIIFIPIKDKDHWTLMVIYVKEKKFEYMDSLFLENEAPAQNIKDFLICYAQENQFQVNFDEWSFKTLTEDDVPGQANSNDCGVFVCQYVEFISKNVDIDFTQADVPGLRKRMAYEIYTHKLLDL